MVLGGCRSFLLLVTTVLHYLSKKRIKLDELNALGNWK